MPREKPHPKREGQETRGTPSRAPLKQEEGEGSAGDVLALYRAEIERANAVLSVTNLETAPRQRDDWWGDWDVPNARFVILHVIAETACHAGHLDATRELLDGRQWVVL